MSLPSTLLDSALHEFNERHRHRKRNCRLAILLQPTIEVAAPASVHDMGLPGPFGGDRAFGDR